ncbi:hypothetical protein [Geosporobacter ferrireducens]|uniref:Uncharacterized protein n=1 Tax=Geosporobacter ferrireducens TaxID=1424294 RepID=A0A1D8GJ58_9FIRM|nr:hypothetical protein [Geosporobacter ferrireducens]AOT70958.1 hypothetical protein Gferi_16145 [Geosporobacter ferrireducens]MTI53673.1 hypothetical protein [Geosporobacter ferrireducens]
MKISRRWIASVTAALIFGNLFGSMLTVGWLNYKLKKDSAAIVREIIIKEQDTILIELRKGLEDEINRIIQQKKGEITGEVRKMIEDTLESKQKEINRQLEKAVDDYIKRKLKSIIPIG